jgi:hypothetical protein
MSDIKDEVQYTTPDEFRLAHKKWAKAEDQFQDASVHLEVAKQEFYRSKDALAIADTEMNEASVGLTRYTVDKIADERT